MEMKHQAPFLLIKDNKTLGQIETVEYAMVARTLAQTCLDVVDFKIVERLRKISHQVAVREYMLLKTGMFETWETLYRDD